MVSKKFYLRGRLQNARTQHTIKAFDYQIYRLYKVFDFDKSYDGQETLPKFILKI